MTYEQNKRIIEILGAMKARPRMYFGKHATYTALHTFLIGYANGIAATNADKTTELKWSDIADEVDAVLFNLITKCERKPFPPLPPEATFFNVPEKKDKKRFDLFMEAFDQVLSRHPEYIVKVSVDEENRFYTENMVKLSCFFNKKEENTLRRKGKIPMTLFKWMQNSKKDFEMSDEQIEAFISAVRKEKHATTDMRNQ